VVFTNMKHIGFVLGLVASVGGAGACGGAVAPLTTKDDLPAEPAVPYYPETDAGPRKDSGVAVVDAGPLVCRGFGDLTTASNQKCDEPYLPPVSQACAPEGTYVVRDDSCACGDEPRSSTTRIVTVKRTATNQLSIQADDGRFGFRCEQRGTCQCDFINEDWFRFSKDGFDAAITGRAFGIRRLTAVRK
jgi:hypothetical protein